MPLRSRLFSGDKKLEACLVSDAAHVTPNARGPHVAKIHTALFIVNEASVASRELESQTYGSSTAAAVLTFKRERGIIFLVIMDRRFWTVFTAKPPGGDLQYIGHFAWRLRYEFMLKWQNQAAIVPVNRSVLEVPDKGVPGRPTEGAIQAMLSSPAGPRANAIGTRAQAATEAGSDPNRRDLNQRFLNTPPDFWTQT